jgi:hypothetical protein
MTYKIYCDLDGVLANFCGGYEKLTGQDIRGEFISTEAFWKPISEAGAKFWAELEWCDDGKELWDYISKYEPTILSAPSGEISSQTGKDQWLLQNILEITSSRRYYVPRWDKMKHATSNSILIDDMLTTIKEWEINGGIGIWHTSTKNTIKQLKELGL